MNETDWIRGSEVKFTGNMVDGFREFIYLDGHKKGTFGYTMTDAERDNVADLRKQEYKDMQAAFGRLHSRRT